MPSMRTRWLLMAGAIFSGVLAGGVLDCIIVGRQAWQQLGIAAWVEYSRHPDLGTGLIAYPVEGIGAGLLLLAAAISRFSDDRSHFASSLPAYLAAAFAIAGLVLTFKAAPIMLSLATAPSAPTAQRAFDDFFFWGLYLRGAADVLAFISAVLALAGTERKESN